jgi:adenosylcobinamide-GDP ribazoletransferase
LRRFWAALTFYTALPLGRAEDLQFEGIAAWLPAVGLFLGGILFLASLLLQVFPAGVRAALLVALWVVLTGGLHLDGWPIPPMAWRPISTPAQSSQPAIPTASK